MVDIYFSSIHEVEDGHHVGEANSDHFNLLRFHPPVVNVNSPPKEDHWLRMGVFLQHDPEQGTAGRQHQLVGTNNVTITYLQ